MTDREDREAREARTRGGARPPAVQPPVPLSGATSPASDEWREYYDAAGNDARRRELERARRAGSARLLSLVLVLAMAFVAVTAYLLGR